MALVAFSPRHVQAERSSSRAKLTKSSGASSARTRSRSKARAAGKVARPASKTARGRAKVRLGRKSSKSGPVVVGYKANPIDHLPAADGERVVFGVMGGAGGKMPKGVAESMTRIGAAIAKKGGVVLTGACPGLPDLAVKGAKAKGGLSVGISPHSSFAKHRKAGAPTNFDVLQTTRVPAAHRCKGRPNFMGREIDNIERSDVVIVAGGRFGTLGEMAIALEERRPVGILTGSGGVADVAKKVIAASTRAGKPPGAPVIYDSNPVRLVNRLYKAKQKHDARGAPRGPIGD